VELLVLLVARLALILRILLGVWGSPAAGHAAEASTVMQVLRLVVGRGTMGRLFHLPHRSSPQVGIIVHETGVLRSQCMLLENF